MLNSENYNLRAYSDGHIGWREACRRLDLENYDELEALLKANKISPPAPNSADYHANIKSVDDFFYGDCDDTDE